MKICLVSSRVQFDHDRALEEIRASVQFASEEGCRLVVFPEFQASGLPMGLYEHDQEFASSLEGPFVTQVACLARSHRLFIAVGILEEARGILYDAAILLDPLGNVALHYRRISPTWKPPGASPYRYREGDCCPVAEVEMGRIGLALCGDIWHERTVGLIRAAAPDYLLLLLYRGYDQDCPGPRHWREIERYLYSRQASRIGAFILAVNAFCEGEQGAAFGGSLIVSPSGEILAEGKIGAPGRLIYEIPTSDL